MHDNFEDHDESIEYEIEVELLDMLNTKQITIEDLKSYIKNNFAGGYDDLINEIIKNWEDPNVEDKIKHTSKHDYKSRRLIRAEITDILTMKEFSKKKLKDVL